jgi:hypothetical protein
MLTQQPPAPLPGNIRPVTPVLSRRGEFVPEVGKQITIDLGGELSRCDVIEVLGPDAIVAKVVNFVVDKSGHGHKKDSVIACMRIFNGLSEVWMPISDREVREAEAVDRLRQQVAAEQTRKAAEARGISPAPDAGVAADEIGSSPAAVPEDVPQGTEVRRVLGPRRSKVARRA